MSWFADGPAPAPAASVTVAAALRLTQATSDHGDGDSSDRDSASDSLPESPADPDPAACRFSGTASGKHPLAWPAPLGRGVTVASLRLA